MKKIIMAFIIVSVLGCSIEQTRNIYFLGGQSNANKIWAESLTIDIIKKDPTAIVVYNNHYGYMLSQWITNEPQEALIEDFKMIDSSLPLNYNFKAIYWFQGEGDRDIQNSAQFYEDRFIRMIDLFKVRYNNDNIDVNITIVDSEIFNVFDIRKVQKDMINDYDFIKGVDSKGFQRVDGVHLSESSSVSIAELLF